MIEFFLFGVIKLAGLIFIVERYPILKRIIGLLDVSLFLLSGWVLMVGSVTAGVSLLFTSILFAGVYTPYVKRRLIIQKQIEEEESRKNFERQRLSNRF